MSRPRAFPRLIRHRLFSLIALVAMFAQGVVAVSPLAEGRVRRMSSHVESHGSSSHYTHDEANCIACQVRSHQAASPAVPAIALAKTHAEVGRPSASPVVASPDPYPQDNPRAPPTVI